MSRSWRAALFAGSTLAISYLAGSFVALDLSPAGWDAPGRLMFVWIAGLLSAVAGWIGFNFDRIDW